LRIFQLILVNNLFPVSFGASNNVIIEIHLVLLFTLHNTKTIAYHVTKVLIFYADKVVVMAVPKIRMYLISRFYSNRENRENLMLAKYTRFTVTVGQVTDFFVPSSTPLETSKNEEAPSDRALQA